MDVFRAARPEWPESYMRDGFGDQARKGEEGKLVSPLNADHRSWPWWWLALEALGPNNGDRTAKVNESKKRHVLNGQMCVASEAQWPDLGALSTWEWGWRDWVDRVMLSVWDMEMGRELERRFGTSEGAREALGGVARIMTRQGVTGRDWRWNIVCSGS